MLVAIIAIVLLGSILRANFAKKSMITNINNPLSVIKTEGGPTINALSLSLPFFAKIPLITRNKAIRTKAIVANRGKGLPEDEIRLEEKPKLKKLD